MNLLFIVIPLLFKQAFSSIGVIHNVETYLQHSSYRVTYTGQYPVGLCEIRTFQGQELRCLDNICFCHQGVLMSLRPGMNYDVMFFQGSVNVARGILQTVGIPTLRITVNGYMLLYEANYGTRGSLSTKCYYCLSYNRQSCYRNKIPTDCIVGIVHEDVRFGIEGTFMLLELYNVLARVDFLVPLEGNLTITETFLNETRYKIDYLHSPEITGSCNFRDANGTMYKCINNTNQPSEYDCDCFEGIIGFLPQDAIISASVVHRGREVANGYLLTIHKPELLMRVVRDTIYYNADYGFKGPLRTQCFYCLSPVSATECDNKNRRTRGPCLNGWFGIVPRGVSYNFYLYDGLDNVLGTYELYVPPSSQVVNEETFLHESKYIIHYERGQEPTEDQCRIYVKDTQMACIDIYKRPVPCRCSTGIISGLEMGDDYYILVRNSTNVILANGTVSTIITANIHTTVNINVAILEFDFGSRGPLNTRCFYKLCYHDTQEPCNNNRIPISCNGGRIEQLVYGREYIVYLSDGLDNALGHDIFTSDIPSEVENTETFLFESRYKTNYAGDIAITKKCVFYEDENILQCMGDNQVATTQCDCFNGIIINLVPGSNHNVLVRYDDHIIAKGTLKTVSMPDVTFEIEKQSLIFFANYGERGTLKTKCSACLYKNDINNECLSNPFTSSLDMICEVGTNSYFKYGNKYNFVLFDGLKNVLFALELTNTIPWQIDTTETFIKSSSYIVQNMDQSFSSLICQIYEVKSMQQMACIDSNNITSLDCNCMSSQVVNLPSGLNLKYNIVYNESILANGILYTAAENPDFKIIRRFPTGMEYNLTYNIATITPSRECTVIILGNNDYQVHVGHEFCTTGIISKLENNKEYSLYAYDYMNATIGTYKFDSMNYTYETNILGVVKVRFTLNAEAYDRQCFFRDDDGFVYSCAFTVCNCQEDTLVNLYSARSYKLNIVNEENKFAGIITFSTPSKAEMKISPTEHGEIEYELTYTTEELPTTCRFCYRIGQFGSFDCSAQEFKFCQSGLISNIQFLQEYTIRVQDVFTDTVSEMNYYMGLSRILPQTVGLGSVSYINIGYISKGANICNAFDDTNARIKCLSPDESCSCFNGTFIGLRPNSRFNVSLFLPDGKRISNGLVTTGCSPIVNIQVGKEIINITSLYRCSFSPVSTCNYYFFLKPFDIDPNDASDIDYDINNADDKYLNQDCNIFLLKLFHYGRKYHLKVTDFVDEQVAFANFETFNTALLQTSYLLRDIDYKVVIENPGELEGKTCSIYNKKTRKYLQCIFNGVKANVCSCQNGRITDIKEAELYKIDLIFESSVLATGELYTSNNGTVNINSLGLRSFNYSTEFRNLLAETSVCTIQLIRQDEGRETSVYNYMYDSRNPSTFDTNTCSRGRIDHVEADRDYKLIIRDKYGTVITIRTVLMPKEPIRVSAKASGNVINYKIDYTDRRAPVNCTFFNSPTSRDPLECSYYHYCDCRVGTVVSDLQPGETLYVYDYEKNKITDIQVEQGDIISAASVATISVIAIVVVIVVLFIIGFALARRKRTVNFTRSNKASNYINVF